MRFLDLDLDAFLGNVKHWGQGKRRPSVKAYPIWTEPELVSFLENQCGLRTNARIPGRYAEEHAAAFGYFGEQMAHGASQLDVTHVDGHADLGMGEPSWVHLLTEQVQMPVAARGNPPTGRRYCTSGCYLAYAVAARWLSSITYVFPARWGNDVPAFFMLNNDLNSGRLQLKGFTRAYFEATKYACDFNRVFSAANATHLEPDIPFQKIEITQYRASLPFERAFLCRSRIFTPKAADRLIPIFCRYIDFDSKSDPFP